MGALLVCLAIQDVESLVDQLRSPNIDARNRAYEELMTRREAVPALERAARSDDLELRLRARSLLRILGAPSVLVEDLRSDGVEGNARRARNVLLRKYDEPARAALVEAAKSEDDQQAIQASFVLALCGDGRLAPPECAARAAAAFFRGECVGYEWVAAHVLLRLAPESRGWSRVLRGVLPEAMLARMPGLIQLSRELRCPVPAPILEHCLLNLRDDHRHNNAVDCEAVLSPLGAALVPALRRLLVHPDAQARGRAAAMLLGLGVPDISPRALVEILGHDKRAVRALLDQGEASVASLETALSSRDRLRAVRAASVLYRLHPRRASDVVPVALSNLETDGLRMNADEAARLLIAIGEPAEERVRRALESDDEQAVVHAAWVLAARGRLALPAEGVMKKIARFARQTGGDEPWGLVELVRSSPEVLEALVERLSREGRSDLASKLRARAESAD